MASSAEIDSLMKQLEHLQDNMRLIEEEIASFVPSDVPLRFKRDRQTLEVKIAQVKQALLAQFYDRARQAETNKDWPQAIELFEQVLDIDKDYRDTSRRRIEAKRQKLAELYSQGMACFRVGDWAQAIDLFHQILEIDKGYRDASQKLIEAKKQRRLELLYAEVQQAEANQDWAQVIHLCQQILDIDENYKDSSQKLAQAKEQELLDRLYAEVEQIEDISDWAQVVHLCQQILDVDKDHRDTSRKLAQAKRKQRRLLWKKRLCRTGQRVWDFCTYHKNYAIATLVLAVIAVGIWSWPSLVPPVTPTPAIPGEQVKIAINGVDVSTVDPQGIDCNSSPTIQVTVLDSKGVPLQPDIFSYNWRFDPPDPHNSDRLDSKNYTIVYSVPCDRNNQTITIEVLEDEKTLGVRSICFNVTKPP